MSKKKHDREAVPNDGFFTNSIASANESTGYAVQIPDTRDEAQALADLGNNPNTTAKKSKKKNK